VQVPCSLRVRIRIEVRSCTETGSIIPVVWIRGGCGDGARTGTRRSNGRIGNIRRIHEGTRKSYGGRHGRPEAPMGAIGEWQDTKVNRRREDDARLRPTAVVNRTVWIRVRPSGSGQGLLHRARSAEWGVAGTGGAHGVPARVIARILLEKLVDLFSLAPLAKPFEEEEDAHQNGEEDDGANDRESHSDGAFVREKAVAGGSRGRRSGNERRRTRRVRGTGGGTGNGDRDRRLVRVDIARR
jgi:hypothetical protein